MRQQLFNSKDATSRRYTTTKPFASRRERAQTLIIVAGIFVALLAFIGLVTDVGSIYLTWTQLKRAVDAAAVAAANNMKTSDPNLTNAARKAYMTEAARETLALNGVTDVAELVLYTCDDVATLDPNHILVRMCPTTQGARKLAWVQAKQRVPVYFLSIVGVRSFPLTLDSIGEAAVLDLVLVFDTSESMGNKTPGFNQYDFDPATCGASCEPLRGARNAAKDLIDRLYAGYDNVSVVTFDYQANLVFPMGGDLQAAKLAIDGIRLHDDAPLNKFAWADTKCPSCIGRFSPVFPEDRDGDGRDADQPSCEPMDDFINSAFRVDKATFNPNDPTWDWNADLDPCDLDDKFDVFDWDGDGYYSERYTNVVDESRPNYDSEDDAALRGRGQNDMFDKATLVSTCIGCGIRMGAEILTDNGRPGGVWVMVFLTDGAANLSDNPYNWISLPAGTVGRGIPSSLHYGYCTENFWGPWCKDLDISVRYCVDETAATCPPGSTFTSPTSGRYSVLDYAWDRIDEAGLLYPETVAEPIGADIVLYSIVFGDDYPLLRKGAPIMHYMADVGDDGARGGPCSALAADDFSTQCGNYYYAANANVLKRVFEDIAARIFTKISR
jgi:hypothetical protein